MRSETSASPEHGSAYPRALICAFVLLFVGLCAVYNIAFPAFEGVDEFSHFLTASWFADHGSIPDLNHAPSHEAYQPPLYHAVAGAAMNSFDRSDFDLVYEQAPDLGDGFHMAARPVAATRQVVAPSGSVLALRIGREVSALFGALVVALTASTAWLLFRRADVTLLATALVAFNPKFIHMSAVLSNDIAVAAGGALVVWLAVRIVASRSAPKPRVLLALGAACGLSMLAKLNGLSILMPAGIALIMRSCALRPIGPATARQLFKMCVWTAAGFAAAAGWYLVFNTFTYGHPLALNQFQQLTAFGLRDTPLSLTQILTGLRPILPTVWGSFGFGIGFPTVFDQLMEVGAGLAIAGLGLALLRRQAHPNASLLGFAWLGALLAFVVWMRSYSFSESARFLAPAASSSAILCALGVLAWFPRRLSLPATAALSTLGLILALTTPWTVLIPAYEIPQPLDAARVNGLPAGGRVRFDNGIELVQARVAQSRIAAGEPVRITLIWRATRPIDDGYVRLIEAIDARGVRLGREDRPPLGGKLSTRYWDVDAVYEDTVDVPLTAERGSEPTLAAVFVSWHRPRAPYAAVAVVGSSAVSVPVGEIRLRTSMPPRAGAAPPLAVFAPWAELEQANISGDDARLVLRAIGEPGQNLTLFLHGYDAAGQIIAQVDVPVKPAAPVWLAGEEIVITQRVNGLSTADRVGFGLYDPATGVRLIATTSSGGRFVDDIVLLR
ncbi:MAG: phospholipid carrier-dependent glycosyltransferase [Thermoflexales bacterium]